MANHVRRQIREQIGTVLTGLSTLSSKAKDTFLSSTDIEFNSEGEKPVAYCSLEFTVEYYTLEQSPDVSK
jgi:hypothetical protein